MKLGIQQRIICIVIYLMVGTAILLLYKGITTLSSLEGLWFLSLVAYLMFYYLSSYFFSKPGDALATSVSAFFMLWTLSVNNTSVLLKYFGIAIYVLTSLGAIVGYFSLKATANSKVNRGAYLLCSSLGQADIIFSFPFLFSAMHIATIDFSLSVYLVLFWLVVIVVKPIELIMKYYPLIKQSSDATIGKIMRIDSPNLIRVELTNANEWDETSGVVSACMTDGQQNLIIPLFRQIQDERLVGTGLCVNCPVETQQATTPLPGYVYSYSGDKCRDDIINGITSNNGALVGFVVENSSIPFIKIEIVNSSAIQQGSLIFCMVSGRKVYYQIVEALTYEETFTSNPRGTHIVTATQVGELEEGQFVRFSWLPQMNEPVFSLTEQLTAELPSDDNLIKIGTLPGTNLPLCLNFEDLVRYHTAILGVTGTGKTELVFDLISAGMTQNTKIICIDVTGDYWPRLTNLEPCLLGLSHEDITNLGQLLFDVEAGEYSASAEKRNLKSFIDRITPALQNNVDSFLSSREGLLGIFQLPDIANTRATLRATELFLSQIFNWAKLNRTAQSILIVLEEAHTIVPEANFYYRDRADTQAAIGRVAQIALQGRKYGVGLLVVTQRTALVSKTILSQCNTCISFNLVDKTSLDYLESVYSSQHVKAIPQLKFLQAIAYGKAVKSDRPVIVEIPYDEEKYNASGQLLAQGNTIRGEVAADHD